jgi:type II secretory pathway component PulJ
MRESVPLPKQTSQQPTQQQISRPLEQETVPLPKNLSPKVKQKLQRNEVKQVPLPKTPEKEELSPEVRQQLQRKVGQVANPPVDGSPLSRTEQFGLSLSEKARKRREAEIARLKGGINQRQQQRQSNIRERPSRISSGGL